MQERGRKGLLKRIFHYFESVYIVGHFGHWKSSSHLSHITSTPFQTILLFISLSSLYITSLLLLPTLQERIGHNILKTSRIIAWIGAFWAYLKTDCYSISPISITATYLELSSNYCQPPAYTPLSDPPERSVYILIKTESILIGQGTISPHWKADFYSLDIAYVNVTRLELLTSLYLSLKLPLSYPWKKYL